MSNPNPKLRNALGISALTAFSLVMIGCGGSSSSAPAVATNASPSAPLITTGPTSAVTKHQYTYNLSSVDPEGDAITYSLSTANADVSITGSVLTYKPSAPAFGGAPVNVTLSVVAKDAQQHVAFGFGDGECDSEPGAGVLEREQHPDDRERGCGAGDVHVRGIGGGS
ncbi:MAG: hypothetical protein IPQ13_08280 [Holophagaceae bacterium]|nr:hypothetical protein [Holophagaceae bacterium]